MKINAVFNLFYTWPDLLPWASRNPTLGQGSFVVDFWVVFYPRWWILLSFPSWCGNIRPDFSDVGIQGRNCNPFICKWKSNFYVEEKRRRKGRKVGGRCVYNWSFFRISKVISFRQVFPSLSHSCFIFKHCPSNFYATVHGKPALPSFKENYLKTPRIGEEDIVWEKNGQKRNPSVFLPFCWYHSLLIQKMTLFKPSVATFHFLFWRISALGGFSPFLFFTAVFSCSSVGLHLPWESLRACHILCLVFQLQLSSRSTSFQRIPVVLCRQAAGIPAQDGLSPLSLARVLICLWGMVTPWSLPVPHLFN